MNPVGRQTRRDRGIAMIIVMWVIMVLSLLISGFAFTMHVETQVVSFSRKELKAEMLARSGIEVVRMQLMLDANQPNAAGFDAMNQAWATNEELYVDHELGAGKYNVIVTDEERKLPINQLTQAQLRKLMEVIGVDPVDGDIVVDSILDWREPGDLHRLNGAKDDYYQSLAPPYRCKNGPFDRVEELLLVRGVTKEMFEGTPATDTDPARPGLRDLLTTSSQGFVNINTASATVLQVILGVDDLKTDVILSRRDGQDGIPGTDDDLPFRSPGELFGMIGIPPAAQGQLTQSIGVQSQFFRVKSTGEVAGTKYTINTVLARQGGNCLVTSWTEGRGGG